MVFLLPEIGIDNREDLIEQQNFRIEIRDDGEAQAVNRLAEKHIFHGRSARMKTSRRVRSSMRFAPPPRQQVRGYVAAGPDVPTPERLGVKEVQGLVSRVLISSPAVRL
jgi:hypothetical protein